jgi:hypothetical protein
VLVAADCDRVQDELWRASRFHFWDVAKRQLVPVYALGLGLDVIILALAGLGSEIRD